MYDLPAIVEHVGKKTGLKVRPFPLARLAVLPPSRR